MKTNRLILRPLRQDDAPSIALHAGDWAVASMTARIPYPYDESLSQQWISGLEEGEFVRGIEFNGELIGATGYFPHDDDAVEIGYWIGKPWWGQGFATEAARELVRYCFTTAGIKRLVCCHFIDNPGSQRVIEKLGFKSLGACRAYCEARGCEIATVQYEMRRPLMARFWRPAQ
ncbi:MAG: GNAT family N-acetyltransferase [Hyphomicrobium sp.]